MTISILAIDPVKNRATRFNALPSPIRADYAILENVSPKSAYANWVRSQGNESHATEFEAWVQKMEGNKLTIEMRLM